MDQARVTALLQRMESEAPPMQSASVLLERVGSAKRKAEHSVPLEQDCSTSGEPTELDNKGDICERARKMQDKNRKAQVAIPPALAPAVPAQHHHRSAGTGTGTAAHCSCSLCWRVQMH